MGNIFSFRLLRRAVRTSATGSRRNNHEKFFDYCGFGRLSSEYGDASQRPKYEPFSANARWRNQGNSGVNSPMNSTGNRARIPGSGPGANIDPSLNTRPDSRQIDSSLNQRGFDSSVNRQFDGPLNRGPGATFGNNTNAFRRGPSTGTIRPGAGIPGAANRSGGSASAMFRPGAQSIGDANQAGAARAQFQGNASFDAATAGNPNVTNFGAANPAAANAAAEAAAARATIATIAPQQPNADLAPIAPGAELTPLAPVAPITPLVPSAPIGDPRKARADCHAGRRRDGNSSHPNGFARGGR